jgi:hypothetical protein
MNNFTDSEFAILLRQIIALLDELGIDYIVIKRHKK